MRGRYENMKKEYKQRYEAVDPTPMTIPVHLNRRATSPFAQFMENMKLMSQIAEQNGYETIDEADDFDVGDDIDPTSPWELEYEPTLDREVTKQERQLLAQSRQEFDVQLKKQKETKRHKKDDAEKPKSTGHNT